MGLVSEWMIAEDERGYSLANDVGICAQCIYEPALNAFVSTHLSVNHCNFCSRNSDKPIACDFNDFIERIIDGLKMEFGDPASEGLPYESREGGWQGTTIDTYDLLFEFDIGNSADGVFDRVVQSIHQGLWCEKDPYSLAPHQTLSYGWEAFRRFILTKSRYLFLRVSNEDYDPNQHDEMNPVDILDALGTAVTQLGLIKTVVSNTPISRVRIVSTDKNLVCAKELGSPPDELCTHANRMSPAGISMFYGAFELETAILETYVKKDGEKQKAICGEFYPIRELLVLDLTEYLEVPSIFDLERHEMRRIAPFLINFIKDFIQPVERSDRAHIDYVPTQVVTEYFRHIFMFDNKKLDGIRYPSSKNGQDAIVLFADSSNCSDDGSETDTTLLTLKKVSEHSVPLN